MSVLGAAMFTRRRGISFAESWADLAPFAADSGFSQGGFTVTGTMGVSGGRLVASSYGSGASWHGPAVSVNIGTFGDFVFDTDYTFSTTNNNELGTLVISVYDSTNGANRVRFVVQDDASTDQQKQRFSQEGANVRYDVTNTTNYTATAIQIRRSGGTLKLQWSGSEVYSAAASVTANFDMIGMQLVQFGTFTAPVMSIGPLTLLQP